MNPCPITFEQALSKACSGELTSAEIDQLSSLSVKEKDSLLLAVALSCHFSKGSSCEDPLHAKICEMPIMGIDNTNLGCWEKDGFRYQAIYKEDEDESEIQYILLREDGLKVVSTDLQADGYTRCKERSPMPNESPLCRGC